MDPNPARLVSKVSNCDSEPALLDVNFKGKLDKTGLPDKQGILVSTL
jgi:hypothetical protein